MSTKPATLDKRLYTAVATATGGRDGHIRSNDGALDLAVATPRELGGAGGVGTNPEQLFAAGYAACFGSALALVARRQKITTGPVAITAHVSIGAVGAGFGLAVELVADLPELPREQAQALLEAAHEVCPYSNATRGNIVVEPRLA
jgi:osmotically inducible protein OsmC